VLLVLLVLVLVLVLLVLLLLPAPAPAQQLAGGATAARLSPVALRCRCQRVADTTPRSPPPAGVRQCLALL